jgi:predicted transposase/invertase (TIGR01784 family)
MSKKARRQKAKKMQKAKLQQTEKATKENKKGLPSLRETEAYIKEHNLKVIDPLSDFGFKRLLASERNKDILIHLLNAFISHDTGIITDITYLPTELLGIRKEDKYVRFDLFCENQDGDRFIVEMQNGRQRHYADRLRVYTSFATIQNLEPGDDEYEHVPRVYSFNIMSVNLLEFKGRGRFFWSVYPKDDDNEIFSKNNVYYFVELSKFAAQLETLDMSDERNRCLYMFTRVVYMPEQEYETLTPMQQRFYEECQITNFTDMEKQGYVKSLMDHADVREMVECEREDAREEGFNEGLERGREEGLSDAKRQLALNMLAKGFEPALIADISGISEDEVRALTVND